MEKENLSTNKSKYGDIIHYKDRKIHRVDGPAWYCPHPFNSSKNIFESWWLNDEFHRADGPAITNSDGSVEFWIHGTQYSEQEFNKIKQKN